VFAAGERYSEPWAGAEGLSFGDCGSALALPLLLLFKVLCEAVLLNLLVAAILDNFSFITDAQSDAPAAAADWAKGATKAQVEEMAAVFVSCCPRPPDPWDLRPGASLAPRLPLSRVPDLIRRLPPPLGDAGRPAPPPRPAAAALALLVRAELNLLFVLDSEAEEAAHARARTRYQACPAPRRAPPRRAAPPVTPRPA
jgi:hypothetical protein